MPVRVNSRALTLDKPDELEREWDSLRYSLASLMLANSRLQKLVISDKERGKRISVRLGGSHWDGSFASDKDKMDLGRIGSILAQSGMINARTMDTWHTISASLPDLTVHAAISTVPSPSKKMQFISFDDNPVLSRNDSNVLFHELNRLFASSDFGNTGVILDGSPSTHLSSRRAGSDGSVGTGGRTWTKPVCKWPMFYIRIETSTARSLSFDGDEDSPDSEKSIQRITDVLGVLTVEFLKQQNMRPRMTRRQGKMLSRAEQATTTSATSRKSTGQSLNAHLRDGRGSSTEESFSSHLKLPSFPMPSTASSGQSFNNWSRVKAAKDLGHYPSAESRDLGAATGTVDSREQGSRQPLGAPRNREGQKQRATSNAMLSRQTHGEQIPPSTMDRCLDQAVLDDDAAQASGNNLIPWVDPRTGKTHMINSRTGQTNDPKASLPALRIWPGSYAEATEKHGQAQESHIALCPTWVDDLLRSWDNPTFNRTEQQVASLDVGQNHWEAHDSVGCLHDIDTLDAAQVAKFRGKLRRQNLATATVIAQVDQKYVLVKVRAGAGQDVGDEPESVLVLIDQHAADERYRVEQLLEEMFTPAEPSHYTGQVRTLDIDPISFHVSATEGSLFQKYLQSFTRWGIRYDTTTTPDRGVMVTVQTLPVLIAERCRLEPNILIDLLRREIWASEEDDGRLLKKTSKPQALGDNLPISDEDESLFVRTTDTGVSHPWVQHMSNCPQGILDLLNSRACRGAIMFNDPLSIEECQILVSRLARCAFPFQCAHGRPSMIPILDLRPMSSIYNSLASDAGIGGPGDDAPHGDSSLDFLEAFRARYV